MGPLFRFLPAYRWFLQSKPACHRGLLRNNPTTELNFLLLMNREFHIYRLLEVAGWAFLH